MREAWRAASYGTGNRPWFIVRGNGGADDNCWQWSKAGNLIRYGSFEAAQRAADLLNGAESCNVQVEHV